MLSNPSLQESRAWYEVSDEAWAGYAAAVCAAAAARRERDAGPGAAVPPIRLRAGIN